MADTYDRVLAAQTDVVAVEHHAPGMVRVVTVADSYVVDARHETCECPDYEYHLEGAGRCKHLWAALDATDQLDVGHHELDETLSAQKRPPSQVATDGGVEQWTVRGTHPGRGTIEQTADSRAEAEEKQAEAENLGLDDVEIIPPGQADGGQRVDAQPTDGQSAEQAAVVEIDADAETVDVHEPDDEPADLGARSVADDPLNWVPGEFVDEIDGSQAINRKGFEVLSHFYDVDVHTELQVPPEETDHEYCRVKATAVTADGRKCEAFGSAHVDRGDDSFLLLEMADTRARKRALSIATGVGAVAVEELKNEVSHA